MKVCKLFGRALLNYFKSCAAVNLLFIFVYLLITAGQITNYRSHFPQFFFVFSKEEGFFKCEFIQCASILFETDSQFIGDP